jgi:hypothetical protein
LSAAAKAKKFQGIKSRNTVFASGGLWFCNIGCFNKSVRSTFYNVDGDNAADTQNIIFDSFKSKAL